MRRMRLVRAATQLSSVQVSIPPGESLKDTTS
jgi:hypothetical protein